MGDHIASLIWKSAKTCPAHSGWLCITSRPALFQGDLVHWLFTLTSYHLIRGKQIAHDKPSTSNPWARKMRLFLHMWKHLNSQFLKKGRPRSYAKSPTVQDAFQPIPGLISCAGVTGRWGLLSHAQNAACWSVFLGSWHATQWKIVAGSSICISLLPSPCAPPGEKRSGEQSWISWTNSQDRAGCVSANTRPRQLCWGNVQEWVGLYYFTCTMYG